jgi:hypothetical protein
MESIIKFTIGGIIFLMLWVITCLFFESLGVDEPAAWMAIGAIFQIIYPLSRALAELIVLIYREVRS